MDDIASRRRRRPILACEPCRRKKIKCDHDVPCGPCTRSRGSYCSYLEATDDIAPKRQRSGEEHSDISIASTSEDHNLSMPITAPIPVLVPGSSWFGGGGSGSSHGGSSSANSSTLPISQSATSVIASDARSVHLIERRDSFMARGTFLRGRFYGPSHWLSFYQHLPHAESDYSLYQDCEPLAGSPSSISSLDSTNFWKLSETIPSREVGNQLILAYLRTFESVLRILHVPTFVRECQEYWKSPQEAREEFVIQLGLVMAIGATFSPQVTVEDRCILLWIDSAQNWLRDTLTDTCINQIDTTSISGRELVQIFCLMIEARQTRHTEKKRPGLISADSLIRAAEHVALHIDPSKLPGLSFFEQEMRRRLWATCQELALQAAVDEGRPSPILRADDNGPAPLNLADEHFDTHTTIVPLVADDFTHTSILVALHKSFPIRHAIAEAINDVSNEMCSYEHALEMSSRIMAESREIFARIQNRASNFAVRLCELLLHRFLLTLHAPFALHAHIDPTRYYSRKVATEIAMSILRHCSQVETDDFARLLRQGSEMFTHVPILATSILCYDLADEEPFSSTLVSVAFPVTRTSLRKLVDAYLHVLSLRIGGGSEEVRPYVLLSAQVARIAASQAGQPIDHRHVITRQLQLCQRMQQGQAVIPHVDGQQLDTIQTHPNNGDNAGAGQSFTLLGGRMGSDDAIFAISPEQLDDCVSNPLSDDNPWMIGFVQNGG